MAEKEKEAKAEKAPKAKKAEGKKKKGGFNLFFFILLLIVLPFIMPTMLICIGLVPTLVAMIVDDDPEKSRAVCIGALNFAGVTPFLLDLWTQGQTVEAAFRIVREPNTWLIMLGAAGVGQLILFAVPPMVAAFAQNQAASRYAKLEDSLGQLKAVWGPEVATDEPLEKVRQQNCG